mmetsp:Transcript_10834/g.23832  ORF Transcript_10834/g.23832 Transcript_10834/m.23832 type:complete len:314 (+) Transcript_10834:65-1006(+)
MVKYRPITTIIIEVLLLVLCSFSFFLNWLSFGKLKKGKKKPLLSIPNTSALNKVSVVIAIKNEARYIGKTIRNLESTTVDKSRVQIILVDCGGKDNSIDVAKASIGSIPLRVIKVPSSHGRGYSFNSGADIADGDLLLFLRADSLVPPGYDETLRRELSSHNVHMTAFKFSFDSPAAIADPFSSVKALSIVRIYQNLMSTVCKLPRGSQGLAVTHDFFQTNKFPSDVVLLEDVGFVSAARRVLLTCGGSEGGIRILEQSVLSSPEEAVKVGVLQHTLINVLAFSLRHFFRVSDETIYRWCYVRLPKCLKNVKV